MENKKENNPSGEKVKSVLPIRKLCRNFKRFLMLWIIAAVTIIAVIGGSNILSNISNREISIRVNFSFDGVESGHDPSGNKFEVNNIKSKSAIENSLKNLDLEYEDTDELYSSISISGNVPANAISRITSYTSMYTSEDINTSKRIQDLTYYPTQYTITMDCSKVDLDFSDCVNFLNDLTQQYEQTFFSDYGYKKSLENTVTAIDYNNYDYIDAVSVFDSSLLSLQDYINELVSKDETRFRSEKTGYTFIDLSKSIEVIRTDDLDMISSYITINNVTKNKQNLIANYQFKAQELERQKKIYEEQLDALSKTIDTYEKNSVLIFANTINDKDTTVTHSSKTYDDLITQKITVQKQLSNCQQKMNMYNERITALKGSDKQGSEDKVKEDFDKINEKINKLISSVNTTINEYYETIALKNAYMILSVASDSVFDIIIESLRESLPTIMAIEVIAAGAYIVLCMITVNEKIHAMISKVMSKLRRKNKKPAQ